ncbi:hypothetical protein Y032_0353g3288 [Ancylostoma ceylanicum]|uniref:Secreted protein n=1 Tax=Ancylostoma ceylanicum TaxID=53326 RepID=A0A016RWG8_9BILA|nr:hypothetical protein Y032_0353g3288 [Ancylostoma ceylanicum]
MSSVQIFLQLIIAACFYPVVLPGLPTTSPHIEAPTSVTTSPATYPSARSDESIVDYLNDEVDDACRSMDDPDSAETAQFTGERSAVSQILLARPPKCPKRKKPTNYRKYRYPPLYWWYHHHHHHCSRNLGIGNQRFSLLISWILLAARTLWLSAAPP